MRSRRGQADALFAARAEAALGGPTVSIYSDYWWLYSPPGTRRRGLLVELGRLCDPAVIREMAALLCAKQPKAKEGAAWVRRYRLGRRDVPDPAKLAEVLVRAVRRYAEAHPALTTRQTVSALFLTRQTVQRHGPHERAPESHPPEESHAQAD